MKIFVSGHSHLSALRAAFMGWQRAGSLSEVETFFFRLSVEANKPNFELVPGGRVLPGDVPHRAMSAMLRRKTHFVLKRQAPDVVVLATMGNEVNGMALLQHPRPFDFESPWGPDDLQKGMEIVSYAAIEAQVEALAEANALVFPAVFAEGFDGAIRVVPPPPPISDAAHLLSYPGAFADRLDRFGVTPAPIRLKIWRTYREVLRRHVASIDHPDIALLELPGEIFDEGGFLARAYWNTDPTHGNLRYGQEVCAHLLRENGIEAPVPDAKSVAVTA